MRWIGLMVLAYATVLVQTTLVRLVAFSAGSAGTIAPDLLAAVAVYVALRVRGPLDVMLAAWALGLAADLTTGVGPGAPPAVGPMAVAYALSAGAVYRLREVVFAERLVVRAVLVLIFTGLAHLMWVSLQSLLAWRTMTWRAYGQTLIQALLIACYTAVAAPAVHGLLKRIQGLFLAAPAGRTRRHP